jgi:NAD(P)-dependent dehydrogenase (short-subunit alcohol dehydrogenase family)
MQKIFITGASRGMGFTRRFLQRGDHVFAACRNPQEAGYLQALKISMPKQLTILRMDVADTNSILDAFVVLRMNTESLDLIINNAGAYLGRRGAPPNVEDDAGNDQLGKLNFEDGINLMRVNAIAPIMIVQQFLGFLKKGTNPRVVSITSSYGSTSNNDWGEPYHYSASKAALNMYMRSLAVDVKAFGITVAVLDPGWVKTEMGGANAPVEVVDSVDGMIEVIDALTPKQNGQCFDWEGNVMEW